MYLFLLFKGIIKCLTTCTNIIDEYININEFIIIPAVHCVLFVSINMINVLCILQPFVIMVIQSAD